MGKRNQKDLAGELGKRRPFAVPEQEAYLNLVRTADHLTSEFARLFRAHGITDSQYNALRILRGHGSKVATRRIAEEMVTREPDITRLIDRMEQSGLASRKRCEEDRRVVWVEITAKGKQLLSKLDEPVMEIHRRQLGHLGARKLKELSKLLFQARRRDSEG